MRRPPDTVYTNVTLGWMTTRRALIQWTYTITAKEMLPVLKSSRDRHVTVFMYNQVQLHRRRLVHVGVEASAHVLLITSATKQGDLLVAQIQNIHVPTL